MTNDSDSQHSMSNRSAEIKMYPSSVVPVNAPAGTKLVKVPVVLTELDVTSQLVANITFPEPVLEIKDIQKKLKIIQSRLLQSVGPSDTAKFTLFLRGFVRKDIKYATPEPPVTNIKGVPSQLRSLTIDIPFECSTTIPARAFSTLPKNMNINSRDEFDFFQAQNLGFGFPEKDQLLSSNLSEFQQNSEQFLNDIVYTELL
ncbi:MAG: DUF3794 domain-containing protein, partial [Bacillota bacterium]|nr:DUF3794 domain-containing protein [Bacillota bacterium]